MRGARWRCQAIRSGRDDSSSVQSPNRSAATKKAAGRSCEQPTAFWIKPLVDCDGGVAARRTRNKLCLSTSQSVVPGPRGNSWHLRRNTRREACTYRSYRFRTLLRGCHASGAVQTACRPAAGPLGSSHRYCDRMLDRQIGGRGTAEIVKFRPHRAPQSAATRTSNFSSCLTTAPSESACQSQKRKTCQGAIAPVAGFFQKSGQPRREAAIVIRITSFRRPRCS